MITALNAGAHVTCPEVLGAAGWRMEGRPGPTFTKFRAPDGLAVILASEHGWIDPKMPAGAPGSRGNASALIRKLHNCTAAAAAAKQHLDAIRQASQGTAPPRLTVQQLWDAAPAPAPGTLGWHYLTQGRRIPEWVVAEAVAADILREGKGGVILAKHIDATGQICGAELRASGKRPAFLGGGTKGACPMGPPPGVPGNGRVFVAEGIIDALAARALEAGRQGTDGTIYASTGGAFGLRTATAISSLLPPRGGHLTAGVDRGAMGDTFAEQLRHVAAGARAIYSRALPVGKDWAEDLAVAQAMADRIDLGKSDLRVEEEVPEDAQEYAPPIVGRM